MNFNSILGLLECRLLALRQTLDHPLLSRVVGRSDNPGGVSRNVMGINLPLSLVGIGLTMDFLKEVFGLNDLPKSGGEGCPLVPTALLRGRMESSYIHQIE